MSEGYSGTPLAKKLGIKPEMVAVFRHVPEYLFDEFSPLPELSDSELPDEPGSVDYIHAFYTRLSELQDAFAALKAAIRKDGSIWISWQKKSAMTGTDVDGNLVRGIALDAGLVDVKVCSVDETWSGMKFMYRKTDR